MLLGEGVGVLVTDGVGIGVGDGVLVTVGVGLGDGVIGTTLAELELLPGTGSEVTLNTVAVLMIVLEVSVMVTVMDITAELLGASVPMLHMLATSVPTLSEALSK